MTLRPALNPELTFIVRMRVLRAMSIMMKNSKGLESTILQIRYCQVLGSSGMKLSEGLATMAK